jgi:hypothetical protein
MHEIKPGYDRVTEVLFPFSGISHVDKEILRKAADRGTAVHKHCDAIISGMGDEPIDEKWNGYMESFKKWIPGKKFFKNPGRLYDEKYMITGECDGIYQDEDGNMVLFDLKTSAKEGKTWTLQGSAYFEMMRDIGFGEDDTPCQEICFVKLDRNGDDPKLFYYHPDFDEFLRLRSVYTRYFRGMEKFAEEYLDII